ncbi:hypothetical protein CERZMDRAFT_82667 [Cercospora zeae-maydis SCOH1-5]|uniref:Myb-like domain-containing protein n=1 Tax=Cercospora zeae-maydis SCOH1-5 TaxID=717836 RepID=A0A6A6FN45_9PEZI|nr:hypothetical protein CERZMDRAFT_82667 [Cercospora zeae-maydis SCOH1-5]
MSFTLFPYRSIATPKMYLVDSDTGQPLGRSAESLRLPAAPAITGAEIRRNRRGKLVMVRHRGASTVNGGGSAAGSGVITFEDLQKSIEKMKTQESGEEKKSMKEDSKPKDKEASSKGDKAPNGQQKGGTDMKAEEKPGNEFTAEEDTKLRELKALTGKQGKQGKSWEQIAEEMGKAEGLLRAHWKELQAADNANDKKESGNKQQEQKKGEGKGKGKGDQGAKENGDAGKGSGKNGGQQKLDKFVFTEDEDKELRELMQAGAKLKTVGRALKKPQDACKKRWEEIGADAATAEPKKEDPPKQEDSTERSGKKENAQMEDSKQDNNQNSASVKQASKAASVAGSVRSTGTSIKFTMSEWRRLQEDDFFSFDELQLLCQLIGKKGQSSWLGIASAFHDKTGRRVHPDDIREKFEAVGKSCL